jgi:tetratricopeptide (TPR) repeat protein
MYAPVPTAEQVRRGEPYAGIVYLRGLSKFAFANDHTAELDTTELESAAALAPDGGWARVEATYSLCAAAAKLSHDADRLRHWLAEHRRQIELADADQHTRNKLMSRFHRMYAFVPQFARDWTGMTAEMDLAEGFAKAMRHDTPDTLAEWTVLGLAVRESRTKEALVLGDLDRAEMWARSAVELCSADPHGWLELGQVLIEREKIEEALDAYRKAVRFGPPGTEIAWFMAGQCYEALGEPEAAADAYLAALDVDPLAISAAQRLAELAPGLGSADLADWVKVKAAHLEAMAAAPAAPKAEDVRPYQQYEGVLGRGHNSNSSASLAR